jgi:hypothetical protein
MAIRKNSRDSERNDIKGDLLKNLGKPGGHIERIYGARQLEICGAEDGELRIPI